MTAGRQVKTRADEYRAHAAECERLAGTVRDPESKKMLEDMAAAWRKLAERAERSLPEGA